MNQVTFPKKRRLTSRIFCNWRVRTQRCITTLLTSFFRSKSFRLFGISSGVTVVKGEEKILFSPLQAHRELPSTIERHTYGIFTKNLVVKHPPPSILKISNAIATKTGANLTFDGKLIQQLFEMADGKTIQDHQLFHFSSKRITPSIRISAEPVVTLAFQWQGNLYHWIYDTIPKLYILENADFHVKRLYIDCEKSFQRESLDLLGIGPDRVIDASQVEALSASELIIPSMPGLTGHPPKWVCDYLRSSFLPLLDNPLSSSVIQRKKQINGYGGDRGEKVFLMPTNDSLSPAFSNLLEKYHFNIVDISCLDFLEQIRLFSLSNVIISFHQPILSHIVFAKPKMKILELFVNKDINPCYWAVANEVNVDYHYLTDFNENEERLEQAIISLLKPKLLPIVN